jgi:hypothetical protein
MSGEAGGGAADAVVTADTVIDVGDQSLPPIMRAALARRTKGAELVARELDELVAVQNRLMPASVGLTKPQDWVLMGDKLYFQGIGNERIVGLWGIVLGKPECEKEIHEDGTYSYVFTGPVHAARTGVTFLGIVGARWSGDEFFDQFDQPRPDRWFRDTPDGAKFNAGEKRSWRMEHRLPVNPMDVRKAAYTNWEVNAVSRICGFRGLTPDDLVAMGATWTSKIKGVAFDTGAKGGGGQKAGGWVAPAKFGPVAARGKPIADLTVEHLRWYAESFKKGLADPNQAQYHAMKRRDLEAVEKELAAREADASSAGA